MKTKRTGYVKASPTENSYIFEAMAPVISSVEIDGRKVAIYNEGWSDARVLEAVKGLVRPAIGVASVEEMRKGRFGVLRAPKPKTQEDEHQMSMDYTPDDVAAIVKALEKKWEAKIADLQKQLMGLEHLVANLQIEIVNVTNANGRLLARIEQLQTHLNGLYQRVHNVEQNVGVTPASPKGATALGEQLIRSGYVNGAQADTNK